MLLRCLALQKCIFAPNAFGAKMHFCISHIISRLWREFAEKLTTYTFYLLTFSALPPLYLPCAFARQMHKASRSKSFFF